MKLAELLNRVVSPVVLGAIFFLVLTPVAFVMRVIGRDAMKRRFEPAAPTYWVDCSPSMTSSHAASGSCRCSSAPPCSRWTAWAMDNELLALGEGNKPR